MYEREPWRSVHLAAHSTLAPALLWTAGRRRPTVRTIAAGWAAHIAVDLASHHDDAWPPLWPLSRWRWSSPVSYWQREHHAPMWRAVEALALAAAVVSDRRFTRRLAGIAALAALAVLLAPGRRRRLERPQTVDHAEHRT